MTAERAIEILLLAKAVIAGKMASGICTAFEVLVRDMEISESEFLQISTFFKYQKPTNVCNSKFLTPRIESQNKDKANDPRNHYWWPRHIRVTRINFIDHLIKKLQDNPKIITEPRLKQVKC